MARLRDGAIQGHMGMRAKPAIGIPGKYHGGAAGARKRLCHRGQLEGSPAIRLYWSESSRKAFLISFKSFNALQLLRSGPTSLLPCTFMARNVIATDF